MPAGGTAPVAPRLEAVGASYGERLVGVDLDVEPGTALGVVGRSGAGKTTLVRLLLGLARPNAGEVRWCGEPLPRGTGPDSRRLRRGLGYVPQHPAGSLDPRRPIGRSLTEPLRRLRVPGDRARHAELVAEACDAVGLEPHLRDRRPHELSGGQAQRAAIARALVTGARVVVADEPVAGLDPELRELVLDLLDGLVGSGRLGLVWVSHDLGATARLCERLLVLDDGRTAEHRATRDLLADPGHPATRALLDAAPRRPRVVEA
ncbi:hypothetical protein GCM10009737_30930 [Nocardioides lentus]|uniref:ABC transporter domain-containing protein n=1 Tax=Nocardioides lentus TaxID=338077 RepID=A0ABN2PS75_9ACTN